MQKVWQRLPAGDPFTLFPSCRGWRYPKWSRDGTELFYTNDGSEYYSVAITVQDDVLIPGTPKLMFKLQDAAYSDFFDVAPDGQRFLFGMLPEKNGGMRIQPTVVVNWFKELREKMATAEGS